MLTASSIEYNKKPGKIATVKAVKDSTIPRDDTYKSGTIHTGPGEPANSVSKPTPRAKQVAARPVTTGKLLRPGGPGGGPSKLASRPKPAPAPQRLPSSAAEPAPMPAAAPAARKPAPQPVSAVAAAASAHGRTGSTGSMKAPPPPPPAPASAPAPKKPMAKALYEFSSAQSNELSVQAGEIVQVVSKEGNGKSSDVYICLLHMLTEVGWWLCMNTTTSVQGWAPEAYLEEQAAPAPKPTAPPPPPAAPRSTPSPMPNGAGAAAAAKAKPAPPAPPAKRPNMAGRKTAPAPPPAPRDSAVSLNAQESPANSGRGTPSSASNASLAGGLAEALRARQSAMRGKQDDDDEW